MGEGGSSPSQGLIAVTLDESSLGAASAEAEHECEIAIHDLIDGSSFAVPGHSGPCRLHLSLADNRLVFDIRDETGEPVVAHLLALGPFRPVVSEYMTICERHYAAIRTASPSMIEAIDMGRRGLHNDAARLLSARLAGKIDMDFDTARRLFTLIVALIGPPESGTVVKVGAVE